MDLNIYRMFKKELHNFERVYKFIQRTYTTFLIIEMEQNTARLMHVTVYGPFLFMETTITGIVYPDMLQQFLIPQTKMTKKDAFNSSKTAQPLITLKCASTSTPVF
jgi:hypothetical protein